MCIRIISQLNGLACGFGRFVPALARFDPGRGVPPFGLSPDVVAFLLSPPDDPPALPPDDPPALPPEDPPALPPDDAPALKPPLEEKPLSGPEDVARKDEKGSPALEKAPILAPALMEAEAPHCVSLGDS